VLFSKKVSLIQNKILNLQFNIKLCMNKNILLLILTVITSFCVPEISVAEPYRYVEINDFQDVNISVTGSNVHITGANGQTLFVYNVAGVCVASFRIEGADKHYELNLQRGCYILKIGNTVRKISLR